MANQNRILTSLKASTLVEVLIAMVIITFSINLVLVISLKITHSSSNFTRLKAYEIAKEVLNSSIQEQAYFDEVLFRNKFKINKHTNIKEHLIEINIDVFNNEKRKIAHIQRVIVPNE